MSFGMSSNVMANHNDSSYYNNNNSGGGGFGDYNMMSSRSPTMGYSSGPFGGGGYYDASNATGDEADMTDDVTGAGNGGNNNNNNAQSFFGTPSGTSSMSGFPSAHSTWPPPPLPPVPGGGGGGLGTISEMGEDEVVVDASDGGMMLNAGGGPFGTSTTGLFGSSNATPNHSGFPPMASDGQLGGGGGVTSEEEQKLAKLRAKIEEKKRLLEQRKNKNNRGTLTPPRSASSSPMPHQQLALPQDMSSSSSSARTNQGGAYKPTSSGVVPTTERETLADATSLVGTCPYMCPDEELERREREGDIQLLEQPRPGELHPAHWTLRDTVVKRFRRSAADYKLDVPEWVRPPDVLEKVCGYLEEWVMVRACRCILVTSRWQACDCLESLIRRYLSVSLCSHSLTGT